MAGSEVKTGRLVKIPTCTCGNDIIKLISSYDKLYRKKKKRLSDVDASIKTLQELSVTRLCCLVRLREQIRIREVLMEQDEPVEKYLGAINLEDTSVREVRADDNLAEQSSRKLTDLPVKIPARQKYQREVDSKVVDHSQDSIPADLEIPMFNDPIVMEMAETRTQYDSGYAISTDYSYDRETGQIRYYTVDRGVKNKRSKEVYQEMPGRIRVPILVNTFNFITPQPVLET